MSKYPLITDMDPTTDQSKDANQVQVSETMSFIIVVYRIKMAQRHISPLPKFIQASSQKLETWSILYNLQAAQYVEECPFLVGQLG